jgi:hypothetical protein
MRDGRLVETYNISAVAQLFDKLAANRMADAHPRILSSPARSFSGAPLRHLNMLLTQSWLRHCGCDGMVPGFCPMSLSG